MIDIQLVVTVAVVVLMLDGGLRPPVGRVFSWPMYAWTTAALVRIEVRDRLSGRRTPVNPYDDFPPGEFIIPPDLLDLYLDYLRERRGDVVCAGHLYGHFGELEVEVGDPRVASGES
ncbi:hypothetical protein [Saccharothrix variisporea]|uniref:Uncharacterized protein n=1 Tax=Saccharothrix variisporea TaxID=543527 RepID=A0A495X6M9_9PSEU|nr:hypothetical protein [Saccharothrix variisporea]RKT69189.1 hypothetical protein DFJ66_2385 [Saccharothrix variisporea]